VSIRTLTQEDPIGLAGGLNLYGFAGGDPINFWDPFGLCAQGEDDEKCSVAQRAVGAVSDFLSSVPGQAIQAGAQAIGAVGKWLTSLVPGARGASEALAGASFGGENLDAEGRAGALAGGAAEVGAAAVGGAFLGGSAGRQGVSRLIQDATDNPKNWRTVEMLVEGATNRRARGGLSFQVVLQNAAGDQLVRHTVVSRTGAVVHNHLRPYIKP